MAGSQPSSDPKGAGLTAEILCIAGWALLTWGLYLAWPPLAFCANGALLIALGVLNIRKPKD